MAETITLEVRTSTRQQMIDITDKVRGAITRSGVQDGLCVVFSPHTTAGITIQENADPDVQRDLLNALERAVPTEGGYHHAEGNAAAHVKTSMMGPSTTLIIDGGEPSLGTWQGIYFCEFDGPRSRRVWVKCLGS